MEVIREFSASFQAPPQKRMHYEVLTAGMRQTNRQSDDAADWPGRGKIVGVARETIFTRLVYGLVSEFRRCPP
ncbi:hypothetical protein GCM10017688_15710 [Streptomyces ramulosus]